MPLIDSLIFIPLSLFMVWLFWFSTPAGWAKAQRLIDWLVAAVAVLGAQLILFWLHSLLSAWEGPDRSIMALASAYLFLVAVFGLGWWRRFRRQRSARRSS